LKTYCTSLLATASACVVSEIGLRYQCFDNGAALTADSMHVDNSLAVPQYSSGSTGVPAGPPVLDQFGSFTMPAMGVQYVALSLPCLVSFMFCDIQTYFSPFHAI
jgi:hypothetical protein